MIYWLLLLDIFLTVSAQLSLRVGAERMGSSGFSFRILTEPLKNTFLFTGLLLYAVSFFLYVFILSRLQLHVVYPIAVGATLILITLASYLFLKESVTVLQVVGVCAILLGIFLLLLPK